MAAHLTDDGQQPVLDLHGCTVDEALALSRQLIVVSVQRKRDSVRLIHGKSTSDLQGVNHTIKHALHDLIDTHVMEWHVSSCYKASSYMIVGLRTRTNRSNRQRITLRDITRR